ncbi:UDP-3-O-(3-hydroxymyristoyl)glucosamine N-acyltransferase [Alienimonas sp. DA493]|uniref:UDP-3-O-(3-hydroxymyristoyl)glucosamine N-acyltransferase n=1 Tax=Alienimonas sp. DA493 TaxID=3373605 RepID=UPI0037552E88
MPLLGDLLPDCPPAAAAVEVRGVGTATHAKPGDLLFLADPKASPLPADCPAAAVLVEPGLEAKAKNFPGVVVPLTGARATFLGLLPTLAPRRPGDKRGVSNAAYVHPSATIADSATVYPGATISEHAVLGEECVVYPGAFVGPGCTLGRGVVLHPNCVLHDGVHLADGVTVQAGAVLGQDGFGFDSDASGHHHLPHHGGVRVGPGALIGANTTVARGMIADTYVGEGTVTDAQVVIAHNCDIGPHNLFCSQVGIAGSVTTGAFVVAAGQAGIADHVTVADQVTLGSKSGVHRDCHKPGVTYLGAPARPADEEARILISAGKLPEMRQTLKALQKQVVALTETVHRLEAERMEAGDDPAAAPELSLREAA